ncbi:MAG: hypothetical protein M3P43_03205 [Actinomycetota bacterium]|nr:hypothetical protein [Actinomycetota bacterium]
MRVHEEDGQALVLALGFLVFVGLVIGAMLALAYASELSTQRLGDQRNAGYAADGATDAAIQVGRLDATVGAYGDARCHATLPSSATTPILLTTTGNDTVASVTCTWSSDPLQPDRTVTFTTFVAGQTKPVVQATVAYHDRRVGGVPPIPVEVSSWTYCTHGGTC